LLNEIDVDMSIYGHYDISGVRDDEPEPCPRTWDTVRKCWNDDWKEHLFEHEVEHYEK
jgi:small subunit ribosomal protein S29